MLPVFIYLFIYLPLSCQTLFGVLLSPCRVGRRCGHKFVNAVTQE